MQELNLIGVLSTGGRIPVIEPKNITANGTYTAPEGVDGFSPVTVNVPASQPVIEAKNITANGTYTAPEGVDGYSPVTVNVPLPQNAYLLKSVTTPTPIASFNDGEDMVMSSLKVAIEPQQEGSGDPSPTNVRPISGWDEVNVSVVGKNKFDLDAVMSFIRNGFVSTQGLTNQDGVITNSKSYGGDGIFPFNYPMTFSSNTITVSADIKLLGNHSSNNVFIQMFDSNGSNIIATGEVTMSSKDTWEHKTITLQLSLLTNVNLVIEARGTNNSVQIKNVQVEVGSTASDYVAYNGHTYTIDLDGTRYGGEVDVVSGVLTVDRIYKQVKDFEWRTQGGNYGRFFTVPTEADKALYDGNKTLIISDTYKGYSDVGKPANTNGIYVGSGGSIKIWDSEYLEETDIDAWKTARANVELCYYLATPITYQLTPTQVKSLLGSNNVWCDTGDIIELEYFSKEV